MSPEKEEQLVAIYPRIFGNTSDLMAINLFGFECGDGWFDLLKELIEEIKAICEKTDFSEDEEWGFPTVNQVKEKYGTLRFYMSIETDSMCGVIRKAEKRSGETCEDCGKPGSMRERCRWYMVRCDECFKADCAST